MEKFGVENIKNCLFFIFELGNVGLGIVNSEDKTWKKYLKLVEIADETFALIKTDFNAIKNEYNDLSDAERGEIKMAVGEKFDIADDALEGKIEECFNILFELESPVRRAIDLFKK